MTKRISTMLAATLLAALAAPTLATAETEDAIAPWATEVAARPLADVAGARLAALAALRAPDATLTGDATAGAIAAARVGVAYQATLLGTTLPPTPNVAARALPSEAALAYLASHGVAPSEATVAGARALDDQPVGARLALAGLIDAFAAFEAASEVVHGASTGTPEPAAVARLLGARLALLDATEALRQALPPQTVAACNPATPTPLYSPPFIIVDTRTCDNTYAAGADDVRMQVDYGGNDVYRNNAGGTIGGVFVAASLTDYGAGADKYTSGRTNGVNGGGFAGSGYLFDQGGNDAYTAGSSGVGQLSASNGGGARGGFGMLIDVGGNDAYTGGWGGSNGGGYARGAGMLVDRAGNDVYSAGYGGVNGGAGESGVGWLQDASGNDVYSGGSVGVNGGAAWCGAGFLYDARGNDRYTARYQGVNGGGSGASGGLFDDRGNDRYVALGIASNGAGAADVCAGVQQPGGQGHLSDGAGCDAYSDSWGAANDWTINPKGSWGKQIDAGRCYRDARGCDLVLDVLGEAYVANGEDPDALFSVWVYLESNGQEGMQGSCDESLGENDDTLIF